MRWSFRFSLSLICESSSPDELWSELPSDVASVSPSLTKSLKLTGKEEKNALALFKTFSHKPLAFDDLSFKSTVNRNKVSGQSYKHFMLVNYDSRDVLPLSICRQK